MSHVSIHCSCRRLSAKQVAPNILSGRSNTRARPHLVDAVSRGVVHLVPAHHLLVDGGVARDHDLMQACACSRVATRAHAWSDHDSDRAGTHLTGSYHGRCCKTSAVHVHVPVPLSTNIISAAPGGCLWMGNAAPGSSTNLQQGRRGLALCKCWSSGCAGQRCVMWHGVITPATLRDLLAGAHGRVEQREVSHAQASAGEAQLRTGGIGRRSAQQCVMPPVCSAHATARCSQRDHSGREPKAAPASGIWQGCTQRVR